LRPVRRNSSQYPGEVGPLRILLRRLLRRDARRGSQDRRDTPRPCTRLQKVGRLGLDVRTRVHEDHRAVGRGMVAAIAGRSTPLIFLRIRIPRHHRAGVSGADEGGRLPVGHKTEPDADRESVLPESDAGDLAHLTTSGSVPAPRCRARNVDLAQLRADPVLLADQDQG